jgi:hypothetical protein
MLFCLKEPESYFYQHVEVKNMQNNFSLSQSINNNDNEGSSMLNLQCGGHAGQLRNSKDGIKTHHVNTIVVGQVNNRGGTRGAQRPSSGGKPTNGTSFYGHLSNAS